MSPIFTDERYLGCYTDSNFDRVLPHGPCSSPTCTYNNLTIDTCIELCRSASDAEYAFAGVEFGNECYCGISGTNYSRHGIRSATDCLYSCSGSAYESCGGNDAIAVFNGKQGCNPSVTFHGFSFYIQ